MCRLYPLLQRDYTFTERLRPLSHTAKTEVYISYRKYAPIVTSQGVSMSQGAYFLYEIHTFVFAVQRGCIREVASSFTERLRPLSQRGCILFHREVAFSFTERLRPLSQRGCVLFHREIVFSFTERLCLLL